jgi:proteasome lid subunit RPN8/RPN11
MPALHLSQAALDDIVGHARRDAPHECCGLLVGTEDVIDRAVAARNDSESPLTRYRINPADHFAVIRALRGSDQRILGAYHSHPSTAASPSPTDTAQAWPAPFLYLIVSLKDEARPEIRAFGIADGSWRSMDLITGRRP